MLSDWLGKVHKWYWEIVDFDEEYAGVRGLLEEE